MALSRRLFVVLIGAALLLFFFRATAAGEVGVNYGTQASSLPQDQAQVAKLLKDNGITKVRIYDTNAQVLTSLANTGIKVQVTMPNQQIADAAEDPSYARQWVRSNVAAYLPSTMIQNIAVGNEVFRSNPELNSKLVPAMRNVQEALAELGLDGTVKVSTPIAFDVLKKSDPPSAGRFKEELAPVMKDLLDFIQQTGSCLNVNIYPFFAYASDPGKISLDYALGNPNNPGFVDGKTGLTYHSLLDAQIDAMHYAIDALGSDVSERKAVGQAPSPDPKLCHDLTECGWPWAGAVLHRVQGRRRLLDTGDGSSPASRANAQAFNNNLINRILSGNTGTPYRPDADFGVYIFALFNENGKGGPNDVEANFGLFYPDMSKVYPFSFQGNGTTPTPAPATPRASWCVANASAGNERLYEALNYSCANGADCSAIQPGGSCFQPDTKVAHASYAFDSYYQSKGRDSGSCDFAGAGSIVYQQPANTCGATAATWCVANSAVGEDQLQEALKYACENGADCSAILAGGACFEPNTMVAHASYAFNSYYQRKDRAAGTCYFAGAGSVVNQAPKFGNCVLPSNG